MKRVCHSYDKWEDWKAGLYNKSHPDPEGAILESLELLSSPTELYKSMRRVCDEWPISAEHNMTDTSINRQAWLGQSSCCISHGATESLTRIAWGSLSDDQREKANNIADQVIEEWQDSYKNRNQLDLFKKRAA